MQVMIDHIAAVIVGAVVLISVFAMAKTSNEGAIEAVQIDMGKTNLRTLVDGLEQDLSNMGSGMANPNRDGLNRVVDTYTESGGETMLRFWALTNDTGTPTPDTVTYRWQQSGTVTFPDGTSTPAWRVSRSQGGAQATFTATTFSVKLLKDNVLGIVTVPPNSIADSLALVRYADVAIGLASPAESEALVQRTQWTKRFRPINLDSNRRRIVAAKPAGVP